MQRYRRAAVIAVCVAWWMVSCREVPAPEGGVLSVSRVLLPSPGIVAGDTMRDSLGFAAPLRMIAFDANGDSVSPQPVALFVALDTSAHLAGTGDLLVGDDAKTIARIVGTMASLQTKPETVKVTLSPDRLVAADSIEHHPRYSVIAGDTASTTTLNTRVQHVAASDTTAVEAVIVRYSIDRAPAGSGGQPTVLLLSGNALSSRDTTDAQGLASRALRLRIGARATVQDADTVLASATSSYRGATIGTVTFTIIFSKQ